MTPFLIHYTFLSGQLRANTNVIYCVGYKIEALKVDLSSYDMEMPLIITLQKGTHALPTMYIIKVETCETKHLCGV